MKAVVKVRGEPNGTELQTVEKPKPGYNDVLIKIKAASICGTDVHIYNWDAWSANRIKPPLIYGHEFAGEIVEVGDGVKNAKVGDYVSGECHIADGTCYNCRTGLAHICRNTKIFGVDVDGIFAEYAVIPAANVWHNDPALPPEIGSIQDPLGNAIHTIFSTDVVGRDVAILGVGPIGAMAVSICKNIGAAQVFAVGRKNTYRTDLAKKVGADHTYLAQDDVKGDILDKTDGMGVDVVFDYAKTLPYVDATRIGLTGHFIESPDAVEFGSVRFGRFVPLTFFGKYMQQQRTGQVFNLVKRLGNQRNIMAVNRTEISEAELVE